MEFDAQVWDKQFEADAESGKLDKIAEQALNDYRAGKAKELFSVWFWIGTHAEYDKIIR